MTTIQRQDEYDRRWIEEEQDTWDGELGAAAHMLDAQGNEKAAALLLDVEQMRFVHQYEDWGTEFKRAALVVPPYLVPRFDDETCEAILGVLQTACYSADFKVCGVDAVPSLSLPGWREHLQERLTTGPRNQATVAPLPPKHFKADGMAFRTIDELHVYQTLKEEQAARPSDDTFAITPNCATRVPDHTWEPDFIVTHRGRSAVIEVDGGSHRGKWGSDKSRDDILTESGFAFVKRLDASDVANPTELLEGIRRFLARLERGR